MSVDEIERRILVLFESAIKEENTDKELAYYVEAIKLGKPVFEQLNAKGREVVLRCYVRAGVVSSHPEQQLQYWQVGIQLGSPVFEQLNTYGKSVLLRCYLNAGVASVHPEQQLQYWQDRKSTRLNSSHT